MLCRLCCLRMLVEASVSRRSISLERVWGGEPTKQRVQHEAVHSASLESVVQGVLEELDEIEMEQIEGGYAGYGNVDMHVVLSTAIW